MSFTFVFGKLYDFYLFCPSYNNPLSNPLALPCLSPFQLIQHIDGIIFIYYMFQLLGFFFLSLLLDYKLLEDRSSGPEFALVFLK